MEAGKVFPRAVRGGVQTFLSWAGRQVVSQLISIPVCLEERIEQEERGLILRASMPFLPTPNSYACYANLAVTLPASEKARAGRESCQLWLCNVPEIVTNLRNPERGRKGGREGRGRVAIRYTKSPSCKVETVG